MAPLTSSVRQMDAKKCERLLCYCRAFFPARRVHKPRLRKGTYIGMARNGSSGALVLQSKLGQVRGRYACLLDESFCLASHSGVRNSLYAKCVCIHEKRTPSVHC